MHSRELTAEAEFLFACVNRNNEPAAIAGRIGALADGFAWPMVFQIATVQGIAPLLSVALKAAARVGTDIPRQALVGFELQERKWFAQQAGRRERLRAILELARRANLRIMLLKSAAIGARRPSETSLVISDDIDLLVEPAEVTLGEEVRDSFWEHNRKGNCEINFGEHHDVNLDGALPVCFPELWSDAEPLEVLGEPAWVPCREDTLIIACINSHRKRYFHLRQLYAICETLRLEGEIDWSVVEAKARRYECCFQVYAALLVTGQMLGCTIPADLETRLSISWLRSAVIRHLVAHLSYSSIESRTLRIRGGAAEMGLFDREKYGPSVLLPIATFKLSRLFRRTRLLLGKHHH